MIKSEEVKQFIKSRMEEEGSVGMSSIVAEGSDRGWKFTSIERGVKDLIDSGFM